MASKEALQNARVWSRRMGVVIDQEKLVKFLDDNFPGSVLVIQHVQQDRFSPFGLHQVARRRWVAQGEED